MMILSTQKIYKLLMCLMNLISFSEYRIVGSTPWSLFETISVCEENRWSIEQFYSFIILYEPFFHLSAVVQFITVIILMFKSLVSLLYQHNFKIITCFNINLNGQILSELQIHKTIEKYIIDSNITKYNIMMKYSLQQCLFNNCFYWKLFRSIILYFYLLALLFFRILRIMT